MEFFSIFVASLVALGIQWIWITGSALRSARARTVRAFVRFERELAELLGLLHETELGDLNVSVRALAVAAEAMSETLRRATDREQRRERFEGFLRAWNDARDHFERLELTSGGRAKPGLRWGWAELALWDCASRLEEERRCWRTLGARWVANWLGVFPFQEDWSDALASVVGDAEEVNAPRLSNPSAEGIR